MLVRLPPFALFLGLVAALMLVPAIAAAEARDWPSMRAFLGTAVFTAFAAGILGAALANRTRTANARSELVILILCWTVVPLFAAAPLILLTPGLGYAGAYFEMMLAFTTTGGTAYSDLSRVPMPVHVWRGLVGWAGGLLTLTAAYVIFAPRRLAGFEVFASAALHSEAMGSRLVSIGAATPLFRDRLARALRIIIPVYTGLTLLLAFLLAAVGLSATEAVLHAASLISTTGVSSREEGLAAFGSFWVELVAACFLVLAATRLPYSQASQTGAVNPWRRDPEIRMMAAIVLAATLMLFLRHWLGALTIDLGDGAGEDAGAALWGGFFTVLSFLTTTGFASGYWESARDWSGLANPGLILLGLCAIGGGAATAAGGVKLIRLYALSRHGIREIDRLASPIAVIGTGGMERRGIRREGAFIAWAFVMLYIVAVLVVMLMLALTGMNFDQAMVAAIAALSNTGQAYGMVLEGDRNFAVTSLAERIILSGAMVLGRIETLALIALFNPDSWTMLATGAKRAGKATQMLQDRW